MIVLFHRVFFIAQAKLIADISSSLQFLLNVSLAEMSDDATVPFTAGYRFNPYDPMGHRGGLPPHFKGKGKDKNGKGKNGNGKNGKGKEGKGKKGTGKIGRQKQCGL